MKKLIFIYLVVGALVYSSCADDLNQYPAIEETSQSVYSNPDNYISVLAKCYGSMVLEGQQKWGDNADLSIRRNEDYMRTYFNLQEAGTDEIGATWLEGDKFAGITYLTWDNDDDWVFDMYYHCYYSISLCNEFLKNSTDAKISSFTAKQQEEIRTYRAEARFLRALFYFHAMDLFHDIPFADESSIGSSSIPEKYSASQIFSFVTNELKDCSTGMLDTNNCEYGHAPRAAAWMLLARLYLNAESYGVSAKYDSCMIFSQKVIDEGYVLESDYSKLFNADNDKRVGKGHEIIFPLVVDHVSTVASGTTTYLICGEVDTDYGPSADTVGCASAWSMFRVRGEFSELFNSQADDRNMLYTDGQSQYMDNGVTDRSGGYFALKWTNINDAGEIASNTIDDGVDTDFPMFRLADAYLMYAESAARTNTNLGTALTYVNNLRSKRNAKLVNEDDLTATVDGIEFKFFLDERAREFYLEAVRRTDLVRFGCFTSDKYLWQWKGGVVEGKAVENDRNTYSIPLADQSANPNLK
ncbi:MAG: RagB/SusD family nutrient uptake outer membrane protein [Marinilabiliaceae bacterium]|nr:RagB/SusD family nutrient uptake outer membrane protein [Marinilabiliaceae bacterium]